MKNAGGFYRQKDRNFIGGFILTWSNGIQESTPTFMKDVSLNGIIIYSMKFEK